MIKNAATVFFIIHLSKRVMRNKISFHEIYINIDLFDIVKFQIQNDNAFIDV